MSVYADGLMRKILRETVGSEKSIKQPLFTELI